MASLKSEYCYGLSLVGRAPVSVCEDGCLALIEVGKELCSFLLERQTLGERYIVKYKIWCV